LANRKIDADRTDISIYVGDEIHRLLLSVLLVRAFKLLKTAVKERLQAKYICGF